MGKKLTTNEWIKRAILIHSDKYDYSKVEYKDTNTKICIICSKHGEFWQTPKAHLKGQGCPKCCSNYKLTINDFLERAKEIHGNKYDYSKVSFNNIMEKVCIICPIHGEFWQSPNDHLNCKRKCPQCAHRSYKKTTDEFIEEATKKFGNKYDYSKVVYERKDKPVCIICPIHGEFWQSPKVHLRSVDGCPKCTNEKNGLNKRISKEEFIEKAKKIHGDKYDYSKVKYVGTEKEICIICPIHGEFYQRPHNHIGQKQGCPYCTTSHLENEISLLLKNNNINFIQEKKFDWLKYKRYLFLDFYLPEKNIAIECHGEQHFNRFRWEKNDNKLKERQLRDNIKKQLCEEHNIKVLYYSYKNFNDEIITDKDELINLINIK